MQGTGYIYHWRIEGAAGRIRVCTGSFAQLNVPFERKDCDAALREVLARGNISRARECPPPDGSLRVRFDLEIREGAMAATNISKN